MLKTFDDNSFLTIPSLELSICEKIELRSWLFKSDLTSTLNPPLKSMPRFRPLKNISKIVMIIKTDDAI